MLPSFCETDQRKLGEAIKRWLEQCKQRWLLIFDNTDDVSTAIRKKVEPLPTSTFWDFPSFLWIKTSANRCIIQGYLPQWGNGSILLTTRADATNSLATSIGVETMNFVEGTHFLLRRSQRIENASDEEIRQAGDIVVALDHFPLALDQAGAYIEETKCRFVDYHEAGFVLNGEQRFRECNRIS